MCVCVCVFICVCVCACMCVRVSQACYTGCNCSVLQGDSGGALVCKHLNEQKLYAYGRCTFIAQNCHIRGAIFHWCNKNQYLRRILFSFLSVFLCRVLVIVLC